MKRFLTILSAIICLSAIGQTANAQQSADEVRSSHTDSVMIKFHQSKWNLDRSIGSNAAQLDSIDSRLTSVFNDSVFRLRHVSIYGGASPEGSVEFNRYLSEQRAASLFGWLDKYQDLSDLDKTYIFFGRDWEGVLRLAKADQSLPYKEETVALLQTIVDEKKALGGDEPAKSLERIKTLRGGIPYQYLYKNVFPAVRASKVVIDYDRILAPHLAATKGFDPVSPLKPIYVEPILHISGIANAIGDDDRRKKPFYMDIRSNMLYDALALPNIGAEFYLGRNLSLGANWMYGWWKCDHRHRYWRAYGGELFGRWWLGSAARRKPLTGHHVGVYGQLYTYDLEWGGEGQMGGKPGGNLWDKNLWGVGVEYGYSLPVAKRINIDFSLGLGYTTGEYHKYLPIDNHYVWQSTHRRNYLGPTKLEIAFVWLLGRGNANEKKGGKR